MKRTTGSCLWRMLCLGLLGVMLLACQQVERRNDPHAIDVGAMIGPESRLVEVAAHVAKQRYGLKVKVVYFQDYALPNRALADKTIDANIFQHRPYLEQAVAARGYDIVSVGKTFIYPMGLYSQKVKHIKAVPKHAVVAIPSDPSNGARGLLLLQRAGLLQLRPGAGGTATVHDIWENPLQLEIKELDAAQLPRILPDVTLAAINSTYATPAGLLASHAVFSENAKSAYANLIVVRTEDKDDPRIEELVSAMHSKSVQAEAEKLFKGQAIPAWK